MYNDFLIYPVKEKKSEKSPTHNLIAKEGEGENAKWVYLGVAWRKEKNGKKFLSVKMTTPYNGKDGWTVSPVKDEAKKSEGEAPTDDIPF